MATSRTDLAMMSNPDDMDQRRKGAMKTAIIMIVIAASVYAVFVGSAMLQ